MTFPNAILRGMAAFVAISIIQTLAGLLVPFKPFAAPHMLFWMFASTALTVAAMSVLAARTEWRGWQLGGAVAALPLVVSLIDLIEGIVFLPHAGVEWQKIFLYTLVVAVLSIPMWTLLFGRRDDYPTPHYHPIQAKSRGERAWKFLVCDTSYVCLYFAAGTIIFPYVKAFYAAQQLPSIGQIVALQFFVRAPLFMLVALAFTRMLGLPRLSGALTVGLVFTLLTGVAPLLMPNPYFPDSVRWVHFCEVTSENFVFAAIVAWVWGPRSDAQTQTLRQAA